MIFGEHHMGMFNDLRVTSGEGIIGALMTVYVGDEPDAYEPLLRHDVERLRDLCEEALS